MAQQNSQEVDRRKEFQAYVQKVVNQVQEDPSKLSPTEKRLGLRYVSAVQRVQALEGDTESLRGQIRQGEARLRSMELQTADAKGKAEALAEVLLAFRFEMDDAPQFIPPEPVEVQEPTPPTQEAADAA